MATPAATQASALDVLSAFSERYSPREHIAALARRVAVARKLPQPSAFSRDPVTPKDLTAALETLPAAACTVDDLGTTWEGLLHAADRRSQGAHFTPRPVAERVAELGVDALDRSNRASDAATLALWDPACGGGAFLLAAARTLERVPGLSRADIVAQTFASDVDPTALDVCDASLELWSGGQSRPTTHCADSLLELPADWPTEFALVIGNPPFLSQLASDTSRSQGRREQLANRFTAASGTYVDEAGLFVELSLDHAAPGGVVALVLPESILGARDSAPMRHDVGARADLDCLWLDEGQSFAAAVDVVAIVARRIDESAPRSDRSPTTRIVSGTSSSAVAFEVPTPAPATWAPLLASALGVPQVQLPSTASLGDGAVVTAGFRQHFYGIATAVEESTEPATTEIPRLITSGAIEPLRSLWGTRPVRFAGAKWNAPVLNVSAIEDDAVRSWFEARCVPKLLLASQTRIVEVIVDQSGTLVPSVPVISVEPEDPGSIWHLAAALTSPAVSAWMLGVAAGTGLSHDAIRIRAAVLSKLPLPIDQTHWDAGAEHARRAHAASEAGDLDQYVSSLGDLAEAMNSAYRVEEQVAAWWWKRLRFPAGVVADRFTETH